MKLAAFLVRPFWSTAFLVYGLSGFRPFWYPILPYTLHDTTLGTTENAKYLWVTISSNLNWSFHINTTQTRPKTVLRFIRQNVKTQNKQLKEAAYRTYVPG